MKRNPASPAVSGKGRPYRWPKGLAKNPADNAIETNAQHLWSDTGTRGHWDESWGAKLRKLEDGFTFRFSKLFIEFTGVVGILFTAWQFVLYLDDRREERSERHEARLERAWNTLQRKVGGETGKGKALTEILRQGASHSALDVGCDTVGTIDAGSKCIDPPIFSGLDARNGVGRIAVLQADNAHFRDSDFKNIPVISGEDIVIEASYVGRLALILGGKGTVSDSDLTRTDIEVDDGGVSQRFFGNNLSGAKIHFRNFSGDPSSLADGFLSNWAWADFPPTFSGSGGNWIPPDKIFGDGGILLCDPSDRADGHPLERSRVFFERLQDVFENGGEDTGEAITQFQNVEEPTAAETSVVRQIIEELAADVQSNPIEFFPEFTPRLRDDAQIRPPSREYGFMYTELEDACSFIGIEDARKRWPVLYSKPVFE